MQSELTYNHSDLQSLYPDVWGSSMEPRAEANPVESSYMFLVSHIGVVISP